MQNNNTLFNQLAGWDGSPQYQALRTLAILKFGERQGDAKAILGYTNDAIANRILMRLSGATPYKQHGVTVNGDQRLASNTPRVFLKVVLMNALHDYITIGKCPQEIMSKCNKLDKFYYDKPLLLVADTQKIN
jgi:hypothetical protein